MKSQTYSINCIITSNAAHLETCRIPKTDVAETSVKLLQFTSQTDGEHQTPRMCKRSQTLFRFLLDSFMKQRRQQKLQPPGNNCTAWEDRTTCTMPHLSPGWRCGGRSSWCGGACVKIRDRNWLCQAGWGWCVPGVLMALIVTSDELKTRREHLVTSEGRFWSQCNPSHTHSIVFLSVAYEWPAAMLKFRFLLFSCDSIEWSTFIFHCSHNSRFQMFVTCKCYKYNGDFNTSSTTGHAEMGKKKS